MWFGLALFTGGCLYLCVILLSVNTDNEVQIDPSRIPMETQTVQYLCSQFRDRYIEAECSGEVPAYESAFFNAVQDGFQASKSTYNDVQAKLSQYQISLEYKSASYGDEGRYFVSLYDFYVGEPAYMKFVFYGDGRLMKIDFVNYIWGTPNTD